MYLSATKPNFLRQRQKKKRKQKQTKKKITQCIKSKSKNGF